jgi:hypothetical protein
MQGAMLAHSRGKDQRTKTKRERRWQEIVYRLLLLGLVLFHIDHPGHRFGPVVDKLPNPYKILLR